MSNHIPKAELHVHVEGALTPKLVHDFAARNQMAVPTNIFTADGQAYAWRDFYDMITRVYQAAAVTLRRREDFARLVEDYLVAAAKEGTIYVELIACPGQCFLGGLAYPDMIAGIADGIDAARAKTGIEARINVTLERHRSVAEANADVDMILAHPHPYIVGIDLAGGEVAGDIPQFTPALRRLLNEYPAPLGCRMHAGEGAGVENIRAALDFGVTRIGHGVRAVEDPAIMRELAGRGVLLEICPTSNIKAGIYPDFASHPLPQLLAAGIACCLNSDDPGLLNCSIGSEYQLAAQQYGLSDSQLRQLTRNAIIGSFAPAALKLQLLAKIDPPDLKKTPPLIPKVS